MCLKGLPQSIGNITYREILERRCMVGDSRAIEALYVLDAVKDTILDFPFRHAGNGIIQVGR